MAIIFNSKQQRGCVTTMSLENEALNMPRMQYLPQMTYDKDFNLRRRIRHNCNFSCVQPKVERRNTINIALSNYYKILNKN